MTLLAPVLQAFFAERLTQRHASPHTVGSYRDTWRLLLGFAQQQTGKKPSALDLVDLDATLVAAFLDHLETERSNSMRTRNLRLAAVHSLFKYAALRCPEHAGDIARVLAIPTKRPDFAIVTFLTRTETEALLASPDRGTWLGRRDYAIMLVVVQTGLRVSELTGLTRTDVTLGPGANVHCQGKGRKERCTPITSSTARVLRDWMSERPALAMSPLFPTRDGRRLSTDAVADLLAKHVVAAARACSSLATKKVTPHTLRHTAAMALLQAGVDTSTIALWLGHSSPRATHVYLHADLSIKEQALARTAPHPAARRRYRPPDALLAFLEAL